MLFNLLTDAGAGSGESSTGSIVFFVILIVAVAALWIWSSISNKKKQKAAADELAALKVGDRVMTIGGVCGFVVEIRNKDNTFVLETGTEDKKSYVRFDKRYIKLSATNQGEVKSEQAEEEMAIESVIISDFKDEEVEETAETTEKE